MLREFLWRVYCVLNIAPGSRGKEKEIRKETSLSVSVAVCQDLSHMLSQLMFTAASEVTYHVLRLQETEPSDVTRVKSLPWQRVEPELSTHACQRPA